MKLGKEWSEYSSLTVYEAAFMLAVRADPIAHNHRCQHDQKFEQYFAERQDIQEIINDKCEVISKAVIAEDILVVKEKHYSNSNVLLLRKTIITKNSFLEWCKKHHYSDVVLAFENADIDTKEHMMCLSDEPTYELLQAWQVAARKIADELFDHDTKNGCRDSLHGYSTRVMDVMHAKKIHGPRGRIDNPKTIQREALQASKWWAHKQK